MHRNFIAALVALSAFAMAGPAQAEFIGNVVSFSGGDGFGVETDDSTGTYGGPSGDGTFDPAAVTAQDGVSLALGGSADSPGSITVSFTNGSVFDGVGEDLVIFDSYGVSEGFTLEISADNVTYYTIGTFDGSTAIEQFTTFGSTWSTFVDIAAAPIDSASFLRLTAAPEIVFGFPQAYDLDTIFALNFQPTAAVPEPATLGLLAAGLAAAALLRRRRGTA